MKKKILSLILVISVVLLSINLIPVSANQISVIGSVTITGSTQQTVEIPAGSYHVLVETDGYFFLTTASCIATSGTETLFSWSTRNATGIWEGRVTLFSSGTVIFTFEIQGNFTLNYINFQIIFTDIDVQTLAKSSIIAEAPYGLEVIGIALIGIACVYIRRRRKGS